MHVNVVVTAGSLHDPPGKPGLAALTATAVEEGGAGDLGPAEVLAAFDALGTQLAVGASTEATDLSFSVLTPKLDAAVKLTADLLTRPRFDATAFGSVQKRRVAEIAEARDDRRMLATEVLMSSMYGDGPRGHLSHGTPAAVAAMSRSGMDGARCWPRSASSIWISRARASKRRRRWRARTGR